MVNSFTEKEISVFNGVMTLSKGGKKIYNITVQDIADAAGVGKGTLYEYFSSKEEILVKTIVYFIYTELTEAEEIAYSTLPFKEKVYRLYDLCLESFESGISKLNLLVSGSDSVNDIGRIITRYSEYIKGVIEKMEMLVLAVLKSGEAEGLISLCFPADYIRIAVVNNIGCINQCINFPVSGSFTCHIEQKKDYAYTILLKTLN